MSAPTSAEPKNVRLVFELARVDNPVLYDDLVRFPQGQRRVNRLRLLAYQGCLSQFDGLAFKPREEVMIAEESPIPASVTNDVFGPGLAE